MTDRHLITSFREAQNAVASATAVALALVFAVSNSNAQGPTELMSSASRPWKTHTHYSGYSIELPDFYNRRILSDVQWYWPVDTSKSDSINISISRIGRGSKALQAQYKGIKLKIKDDPDEGEVIDSSFLTDSSFRIYDHEPGNNSYFIGKLTSNGVFQTIVSFAPAYKSAVDAMLPKMIASLRANSKDE